MKIFQIAITFSFLFLSLLSSAQTPPPLAVVQKQLDAYNAQDIDAFEEVFAENAEVFRNIGDEKPYLEGRKKIRKEYKELFKENPNNKSTLMGRIVQGDFVIDHEWITGRGNEFEIVAIYEVKGGLIQRAWFIR